MNLFYIYIYAMTEDFVKNKLQDKIFHYAESKQIIIIKILTNDKKHILLQWNNNNKVMCKREENANLDIISQNY